MISSSFPSGRSQFIARWSLIVIFCAGLSSSVGTACGQEPGGLAAAAAIEEAFIKAIESAEKSVVSISRDKRQALALHDNRPNFGRGDQPQTPADPDWIPNEFGAGVVIDKAGLILTNYHLVRGGPIDGRPDQKSDQLIYVHLPDRRAVEAQIFAADPRSDLAVLRIPVADLVPLKFGNVAPIRKGQLVIALGNPYAIARDGSASATWGIVSNVSRQVMQEGESADPERRRRETIHHLGTLLQVDTRLELGTSGGALLNLQGELIGMTTSLAAIVGYEKSAGFAIPFDDAMRRIIESLRQGKEVEYGFLGIHLKNVHPSELARPEFAAISPRLRQSAAVRIDQVLNDLPAFRAGLKANDLVVRVEDKPVLRVSDLMREIGLAAPGTTVRVKVLREVRDRNWSEIVLPVEVGKWPVIDEEGIVGKPQRDPWRGISYDYVTARSRYFNASLAQGLSPGRDRVQGVRVLEVRPGSPAAAREVQPGDLITHVRGVPVLSPRDFAEAVNGQTGPVMLTISTPSDRNSLFRQVEIKSP
jgi:serine protease Do